MSNNPNKNIASAIKLLLHNTDKLTRHDKLIIDTINELSKQTETISPINRGVSSWIADAFTLTTKPGDRILNKRVRELAFDKGYTFHMIKKSLLEMGCGEHRTRSGRYITGIQEK